MRTTSQECENCALQGRYTRGVKEYVSVITGERTRVCSVCYVEQQKIANAVTNAVKAGPYTNQTESGIGHKGGMSAEMAELLSGSKAAEARAQLIQVLTEPMTAEQASRKAKLDPDYGSPRISELINKGLVVKHDGKGRSDRGNPCGRYIITELAKELAA